MGNRPARMICGRVMAKYSVQIVPSGQYLLEGNSNDAVVRRRSTRYAMRRRECTILIADQVQVPGGTREEVLRQWEGVKSNPQDSGRPQLKQ